MRRWGRPFLLGTIRSSQLCRALAFSRHSRVYSEVELLWLVPFPPPSVSNYLRTCRTGTSHLYIIFRWSVKLKQTDDPGRSEACSVLDSWFSSLWLDIAALLRTSHWFLGQPAAIRGVNWPRCKEQMEQWKDQSSDLCPGLWVKNARILRPRFNLSDRQLRFYYTTFPAFSFVIALLAEDISSKKVRHDYTYRHHLIWVRENKQIY